MESSARGSQPPVDSRDVDRSLVTGVAWNGIMKIGSQTIAWASTIVVARLLAPDDYGLMGMAALFLGLLQLVSEFGISLAVVNHPELTAEQLGELNTVSVVTGLVGTLLVTLTAPLVAWFFHSPRLTNVLLVLSVTFLINSVRSVPWGILQRDLRFKRLAIYDAVLAVALAAFSVTLAWMGFRYWTLVLASLASGIIATTICVVLHPLPFRYPHFSKLKKVLAFSRNIVSQRISWYSYSNADFLVAGKVLGSGPLGVYTLAWSLSHVTDKATALILQVTPPILAKVKTDHLALRRYLIRITEIMGLTVMPLMIGLALVAPEFVAVVLGPKWIDMVVPLQVLSAYASVNVLLPLMSQVLNATGEESFVARNNMLQVVVMPVAFVIGAMLGGVAGLAYAWVIAHPLIAFRLVRHTLHRVGMKPMAFLREAIWPGLGGCIAMSVGVTVIRFALPTSMGNLSRLAAEIFCGIMIYIATVVATHGRHLRELGGSTRSLLRTV